jgi:uncharacterized protein (TIGR03067 family)
MRLAFTLLAALSVTAAVAAPVPKGLKEQAASLDGTWEVVEWYSNGGKVNSTVAIKWTVSEGSLTIERTNAKGGGLAKNPSVTYSLVKPDGGAVNALDYTITYANAATPPRVLPGVFELDDDSLKFCYVSQLNGTRPTECKAEQGNVLYVFKRVEAK